MESTVNQYLEWRSELQFESARRMYAAHRRARRLRSLFVVCSFTIIAGQICIPDVVSKLVSTPILVGTMLFLSLFTLAAQWSTCPEQGPESRAEADRDFATTNDLLPRF